MKAMDFQGRLKGFRELFSGKGMDGFVVSRPVNRYYLSGYTPDDHELVESSGFLFIGTERAILATDGRYSEQAGQEARGFELYVYGAGDEWLKEVLFNLGSKKLGFESQHLTYRRYEKLKEALDSLNPGRELAPCENLVEEMRAVKEPGELASIRSALSITERVMAEIAKRLGEGASEVDMGRMTEDLMRDLGAQAVAFEPIVASGENSARPHARPTSSPINGAVVVDIGARLDYYCSDMTRTFFVGEPPDEFKRAYAAVRDAQAAAAGAMRPGVTGKDVDAKARELLESRGYGEYFAHSTGHGVGLSVHELPTLGPRSENVLEPGMVVTVEPGVYMPGSFGVRLENMAVITEEGAETLNELEDFYDF